MSLKKYIIDFSKLSSDEKTNLMDKIESLSFNGLFYNPSLQIGEFFVYEDFDINLLNVPELCNLTRTYQ